MRALISGRISDPLYLFSPSPEIAFPMLCLIDNELFETDIIFCQTLRGLESRYWMRATLSKVAANTGTRARARGEDFSIYIGVA